MKWWTSGRCKAVRGKCELWSVLVAGDNWLELEVRSSLAPPTHSTTLTHGPGQWVIPWSMEDSEAGHGDQVEDDDEYHECQSVSGGSHWQPGPPGLAGPFMMICWHQATGHCLTLLHSTHGYTSRVNNHPVRGCSRECGILYFAFIIVHTVCAVSVLCGAVPCLYWEYQGTPSNVSLGETGH